MQVMDRLPQSVSACIAHVVCLPATINFRNALHWVFFSALTLLFLSYGFAAL
jgi:hypothetical protein